MGKLKMDLLKGIEEQENTLEESKAYQEEERFLNLLRQGKSRKEAYEAIGREKTWASKTIKKIRETEPERLKGTGEEVKAELQEQRNTPQDTQKPQIAPEPPQADNSTPAAEKDEETANTKHKKQVFSFRATLKDITDWKSYATATGEKMENMGTAAMNEYIDNHPLTGAEKTVFEAMKAKTKNEK